MLIRIVIVVSAIAAAVFWGFAAAGVFADWGPEQPEGRLAVTAIVAGTATLAALACWLDLRRAGRDKKRNENTRLLIETEQLLIRTLACAVPPKPVKRVQPFPRAL